MSEVTILQGAQVELSLDDQEYERSLLDQLLSDSRLYKTSREYHELLAFVIRLRNMAPFNAMLLQIQKPGLSYASDKTKFSEYNLGYNHTHKAATTFVTLAHELGHLFLGHLGDDKKLGVSDRRQIAHRMREIEAESVAYIVSHRNSVECRAEKYLHSYVEAGESAVDLDLYAITRAAGHIERLLDLSNSTQWTDKS